MGVQMKRKRGRQTLRKSDNEGKEIETLEQHIAEGAPLPIGSSKKEAEFEFSYADVKRFSELPISDYTKKALKEAKFVSLTAIQRCAVPQALCGRDVLGAAKTGSGKTLAFIIPVMELLYRQKWGLLDGLGALIISPTRELALQIFNELRKVGKYHDLSAGLLVGGNNVKEERDRIGGLNILICTPGRLLQHMDETPNFDSSAVQILVLDEADRILDMGFSVAVNAIVENLPQQRQTLLFSATQTKSVTQLARLSLNEPQYVSVHENSENPTPVKLEQAYAIVELHDKLNVLWSFIRSHIKAKILVFASTCKQVRFLFEAFSRLRPGCPLRSLHGGMKQIKRMAVFYDFAEATSGMVLFATDIAARGLDFAKLDWVFQMDCPEDSAAYIHRVGRTARYVSAGRGLLLLCPSETEFLKQLESSKVPIKGIKINPHKTQPISPALQALLSKNQELKESAQSSITSYLKSVFLAPNKAVFDVSKLPITEFALSMGLSAPPKLRFIKKALAKNVQDDGEQAKTNQQEEPHIQKLPSNNSENASDRSDKDSDDDSEIADDDSDGDSDQPNVADDALMKLKKSKHHSSGDEAEQISLKRRLTDEIPESTAASKIKKKKMKIRVGDVTGRRVVFDEEGQAQNPLQALAADNDENEEDVAVLTQAERFAKAAAALKVRDAEDKKAYNERKRAKNQEKRAKQKQRDAEERGEETIATLGPGLGFPGEEDLGSYDGSGSDDNAPNSNAESDDDMDWNSDDPDAVQSLSRKAKKLEKSHMGMTLKTDQPEKKSRKQNDKGLSALSVQEQEALALQLLSNHT